MVHRAEVQEGPGAAGSCCATIVSDLKEMPVPDRALVVEQCRILGVPIAGYRKNRRCVEVILHSVARRAGLEVSKVPLSVSLPKNIDVAGVVRIKNCSPFAIERPLGTAERIGQQHGVFRGER